MPTAMPDVMRRRSLVFVNTIPKSGTHLLLKLFQLAGCSPLTGLTVNSHSGDFWPYVAPDEVMDANGNLLGEAPSFSGDWITMVDSHRAGRHMRRLLRRRFGRRVVAGHMLFDPQLRDAVTDKWPYMIIAFRDPRSVAVSHANWVMDSPGQSHPLRSYYTQLAMPERIRASFLGIAPDFRTGVQGGCLPLLRRYKNMLRWLDAPFVHAVRFEGFVPSCSHFERNVPELLAWCDLDPDKADSICPQLFGGTATFREGATDSWKEFPEVFSDSEIVDQVKEINALLSSARLLP